MASDFRENTVLIKTIFAKKYIWYAPYILSVAFLVLSQVYLFPKVMVTDNGLDFRLIWLAGRLWSEGMSPYSEAFLDAYRINFGNGPISHFWVYPPYWWIISRPLGGLPFETALMVWNIANYTLLILAAAMASMLQKNGSNALPCAMRFILILALLSFVQATPFAISIGQTTFLVLSGLALLLRSSLTHDKLLCALGVSLVMLKPNYGLFIVICMLWNRWTWGPIAAVVGAYIAAIFLAAIPSGLVETVSGFLGNLSLYSAPHVSANQPENQTGIVHLAEVFGVSMYPAFALGLSLAIAVVTGLVVRPSTEALLVVAIATAFLVPLHTYDLTFCVFLVVVLLARGTPAVAMICLISLIFLVRPANLAALSGVTNPASMSSFQGSLVASIGLALLCIAAFVHLSRIVAKGSEQTL